MKTTLTCASLILASFSTASLLADETQEANESVAAITTLQSQVAEKTQVFDPESKAFVDFQFTESPKYFILYYSASWCPPCRAIAKDSVTFYADEVAETAEVELIMINADNTKEAALKWAQEHTMVWPMFFKADIQEAQLLIDNSPTGIPHMVLVDGEGKALLKGNPNAIKKDLKKMIEEIKEGKTPAPVENMAGGAPAKPAIPVDEIL